MVKGLLAVGGPLEPGAFLCKGVERCGDAGKVRYKSSVILAKAYKSTALAEILRDRPIFDGGDFVGVSASWIQSSWV